MIPLELTNIPQWVCAYNNSKIPMRSTVKTCASCSNPESWSTFEEAVNNKFRYDSVGFVLANNGIVIVDIDDCVENGMPNDFAMDLILKLRSYTEISRSGTGIHIVCKGNIPFDGKNNHKQGIEIYQNRRYVIITGNTFLFNEVIEPQEEINDIVNVYFNEEALKGTRERNLGISKAVIYAPVFNKQHSGLKIDFTMNYPIIENGGRNHCLTSYGGQLRCYGYSAEEIFDELCICNQVACNPPLPEWEVKNIARSVTRYER